MIRKVFEDAFDEIEGFTQDLEKEKSFGALQEMKSVWRIVKSIQLRYCLDVDPDRLSRLDRTIDRLEIQAVAETDYSEKEAELTLRRFKDACGFRHEFIPSEVSE